MELSPYPFQSTHPHGVRQSKDAQRARDRCFNPRTRTGCDEGELLRMCILLRFNPRTRTGCDPAGIWLILKNSMFQSTHPHGVRPSTLMIMLATGGFNPRTRTGCDTTYQCFSCTGSSFNPRTRTGCDVKPVITNAVNSVFQSTHPHGVRQRQEKPNESGNCFNPRTRTGCDIQARLLYLVPWLFQSTHPHGVRQQPIL